MASILMQATAAQGLLELASYQPPFAMKLEVPGSKQTKVMPNLTIEQLLSLYESPKSKKLLANDTESGNNVAKWKRNKRNGYQRESTISREMGLKKTHNKEVSTSPTSRSVESNDPTSQSEAELPSLDKPFVNLKFKSKFVDTLSTKIAESAIRASAKRQHSTDLPLDLSVKKVRCQVSPRQDDRAPESLVQKRSSRDSLTDDYKPKSSSFNDLVSIQQKQDASVHCTANVNGCNRQSEKTSPPCFENRPGPADTTEAANTFVFPKFKFDPRKNSKLVEEGSSECKDVSGRTFQPITRLLAQSRDSAQPIEKSMQFEHLLTQIYLNKINQANIWSSSQHGGRLSQTTKSVGTPPSPIRDINEERFRKNTSRVISPYKLNSQYKQRRVRNTSLNKEERNQIRSNVGTNSPISPIPNSSISLNSLLSTLPKDNSKGSDQSTESSGNHQDGSCHKRSQRASRDSNSSPNHRNTSEKNCKNHNGNIENWFKVASNGYPEFGKFILKDPRNNSSMPHIYGPSKTTHNESNISNTTAATLNTCKSSRVPAATHHAPPVHNSHVTGGTHSCPGCRFSKDASKVVQNLWRNENINRYTNPSLTAPEVVYCWQLHPHPSTTDHPTPGKKSPSPYNTDCDVIASKSTTAINSLKNYHSMDTSTSGSIATDCDVNNNLNITDDDDDDLLANHIQESSDEEDDEPIREGLQSRYLQSPGRMGRSWKSLSNGSLSRPMSRNNAEIQSFQSQILRRLILNQVLSKERRQEKQEEEEVHLSDIEISDDEC